MSYEPVNYLDPLRSLCICRLLRDQLYHRGPGKLASRGGNRCGGDCGILLHLTQENGKIRLTCPGCISLAAIMDKKVFCIVSQSETYG